MHQLKNISVKSEQEINDFFIFNIDFNNYYKDFKLLCLIYKQSIISLHDYYLTSVAISEISSNNQSVIDKMEFWVFNNYMPLHNEVEKLKEGKKSGDNSSDDITKKYNESMKSISSSFKHNTPKLK